MSIVYSLLLFALLVLILYATWQPSSIKKPRHVQKEQTTMKSAHGASKRTELAALNYPTTDVRASARTAGRR